MIKRKLVLKREMTIKELLDAMSGYLVARFKNKRLIRELIESENGYEIKAVFRMPAKPKNTNEIAAVVNIFSVPPHDSSLK